MSHHNHYNHGRPNLSGDNAHSVWPHSDQGWPTLPPLTVALPISDPLLPNNTFFTSVQPYGPLNPPQQQPTHPTSLTYLYEQFSRTSSQIQGGSDNGASPSSSTAYPGLLPPSDISGGGSGLHSPLLVESSFSQYQSPASQVAGTTVAVINTHCQPPLAMVPASLPPTTAQVPYASVLPLVSHDLSAEAPEPTTTKKRKVKDARQKGELNRVYARTPYPPTEMRQQLARDLDLTPRCVQIWFQNQRQKNRVGRNSANLQVTIPDTPPIAADMTSGQTPSPADDGSASADIDPCAD